MRCGSRGCSCTSCEDCGKLHEHCTCDLKQRTQEFLDRLKKFMDEADAYKAEELLREWVNAS
jgi:hypothetical protein